MTIDKTDAYNSKKKRPNKKIPKAVRELLNWRTPPLMGDDKYKMLEKDGDLPRVWSIEERTYYEVVATDNEMEEFDLETGNLYSHSSDINLEVVAEAEEDEEHKNLYRVKDLYKDHQTLW